MKKITIKSGIAVLAFGFLAIACEKDYEPDTIENYEMSGQWLVQTYFGGTTPADVVLGYQTILTSNTAAADGSTILIDDMENIWPFKVKASANSGNYTFNATSVENMYEYDTIPQFVTITNGKITPEGGRSLSGVTVDSIYMECEFSDDPGNVYIIAGHYRTGFTEDEP